MNSDTAKELLEKLKQKELDEITVSKEDFLTFRAELTKRADFKHFKGIAKHGGITSYVYCDEARS
nr:hypothetical protein [Bacillus testis]